MVPGCFTASSTCLYLGSESSLCFGSMPSPPCCRLVRPSHRSRPRPVSPVRRPLTADVVIEVQQLLVSPGSARGRPARGRGRRRGSGSLEVHPVGGGH